MLHVIGGTYLERCLFPEWDELFGSGLRAAMAVKNLGCGVEFHTYVSRNDAATLKARAAIAGFTAVYHEVPETVGFEYFHGLSNPVIVPPPHIIEPAPAIELAADNILRYGFIEGDAIVHGERVVYDPQSPHKPVNFESNGSTATHLAMVTNRTEGELLTGEQDPKRIGSKLVESQECRVAVVKCGSRGCVVAEDKRLSHVPAFKTDNVWPIGSGDVFAAAFAKAWAVDGRPAKDAAELASKATAFFCNSMNLDFPTDFPASFNFRPIEAKELGARKRVYLAGPFFSMSQNWLIEQAFDALLSQGLKIFSPLHHVGRGPADEVYDKDIDGIENCDLLFACVDGLDSGTIFEIGYARALDKPVVAFVQNETSEDLMMLEGSGCLLERDFVTAIYKTYWLATS